VFTQISIVKNNKLTELCKLFWKIIILASLTYWYCSKLSVDIDATPDLLLPIQQQLHIMQYRHSSLCVIYKVTILIIIITMTIFIVLSSTVPAICESSLWFIWTEVGQHQVAANS